MMEKNKVKKTLTAGQNEALLSGLRERFEKNMKRHENLEWGKVLARLDTRPEKKWSLYEMEKTGGEPDVIVFDKKAGEFVFCDCSPESPAGRRSYCYDGEALKARKENKPKGSVVEMAEEMGIEILDEEQYRRLQELGSFDTKSQSWIKTPSAIRKLGGAIFADRRYDHVFVYHNGAESYYAARGFRGMLSF